MHSNRHKINRLGFPKIWLIPILTLLLCLGLLIEKFWQKGPVIELVFNQAEDITVDKTEIKTLNVTLGIVRAVNLSKDFKHIIAQVEMHKKAKDMLKADTQFWVVKPRIKLNGVSGLSTLFSGAYIQMRPGQAERHANRFEVMDEPPIESVNAKGIRLNLVYHHESTIEVGNPIFYKGFVAGRVEKAELNIDQNTVHYQIFIAQPYDQLVFHNSQFWIKNPIDIHISEKGLKIQMASLENLFTGGISFDLAKDAIPHGQVKESRKTFHLLSDKKQIKANKLTHYQHFVMLFDESIKGLKAGANIEYRGIELGAVIEAPISTFTQITEEKYIPVLVSINLALFESHIKPSTDQAYYVDLIKQGLFARLHIGNLLTGQLYIELEFDQQKTDLDAEFYENYPVFPTQPGSMTQIQHELSHLINSLKRISIDTTINQFQQTLTKTTEFMQSGKGALNNLNNLLTARSTKNIPSHLNQSLKQLEKTLTNFNQDGLPLNELLIHFDDVMLQLKPLLEQLQQKPNALIFKGSRSKDPIPGKLRP